jgi:hypothetical protein
MKGLFARPWLIALAVGSALLVYFAPERDNDALQLAERPARAVPAATQAVAGPAAAPRPGDVLEIKPRGVQDGPEGAEWFSARNAAALRPTAPKVEVTVAPLLIAPAPQAPPLPFRFLGRYDDDGDEAVFLQNNEQTLVVRVGETVQSNYKIVALSANTLTLRYLPLDLEQTLDVSSAK